ncbi:MerR family transcriptional regulator [Fictibacillus nanhaiensis]|uniref:MerR family transcriptional regulator n=1 Tax=Fictibacillus nanhaiensis TaxID=742169 RepID=UPI001C939B73|nr:MerR family transcriptional regulator [Fictibacillus nanhaiensis]MBY6035815.1 MerR family transcriptional regulator [Fictibacillus nanhaiensis]
MEYTVQKLALLAGVSTRTLRYYDTIGILKPAKMNSSGYRIYGQAEVDRLQQILFYKELGFNLVKIKEIITSPAFNAVIALKEHREQLLSKRSQIDQLIHNVEKTIASNEGRMKMTNQEKFEGFKQKLIRDNEKKYGNEIREKYGDDIVDQSNQKFLDMTKEKHDELSKLTEELNTTLEAAYKTGDPSSDIAQKTADLHKQWLMYYWKEYNEEAHSGLADMYVDDDRFTAYYDKNQPGTAKFLRDAIHIYTGKKQ